MEFRIAGTFFKSLATLANQEKKAAKIAAFELQSNPANPGLSFHKLDRLKDQSFCSVKVNRDIRIIVHKTGTSLMLCYVGHHDDAYAWASRRKIENHPKTGAAQLVEVRERIEEIPIRKPVAESKPVLFESISDDDLLEYGVPEEWLSDVRSVDEDSLYHIIDHLPEEAAEALIELADGGNPKKPEKAAMNANPFNHPDAQKRFRILNNAEELAIALESYTKDSYQTSAKNHLIKPDTETALSSGTFMNRDVILLENEIMIEYKKGQKELYLEAVETLREKSEEKRYDHRTDEQKELASQISQKYREKGLQCDISCLAKGIWSKGNFNVMLVKKYMENRGFHVYLSEINYLLTAYGPQLRETTDENIKANCQKLAEVFGTDKIRELINEFVKERKLKGQAASGGEPAIFACKNENTKNPECCFLSPKSPSQKITDAQSTGFRVIKKHLCPVIIARVRER